MSSGRCTRRSFVSRRPLWPPPSPPPVRFADRAFAQGATPAVPDVGPLKVGWSTIYTTPSWMTETQNEIEAEIERLRGLGMEIEFQVFDANGDTATQIAQIQTMIDQAVRHRPPHRRVGDRPRSGRRASTRGGAHRRQLGQPGHDGPAHREGQHRSGSVGSDDRPVARRRARWLRQDPGDQRSGRYLRQRGALGRSQEDLRPESRTSRSSARRTSSTTRRRR